MRFSDGTEFRHVMNEDDLQLIKDILDGQKHQQTTAQVEIQVEAFKKLINDAT